MCYLPSLIKFPALTTAEVLFSIFVSVRVLESDFSLLILNF